MATSARGPGWLFHVTAGATTAFIISVLAMVATLFGDPAAPINGWINQYGAYLLLVEIVAIGVFGFAAMANDARVTRLAQREVGGHAVGSARGAKPQAEDGTPRTTDN
ncbi:MAG: hypothetical protein Q8K78_14645 [Planctomycetaceae bacterium]|nr:hypothetical protein [Planctomycetaceae bacterium]